MKNVLIGFVLILLSACKTTQASQTRSALVKPSALIGTAYDAYTHEFTGMSCLDVTALGPEDYEMTAVRDFSTTLDSGMSEVDLEKIFGSFQKSFYSPATGLRLSRPYETVQRIQAGDADVVQLVSVQSERGIFRFRTRSQSKLRLNPDAQRLVQKMLIATEADRTQRMEAFVQACGTGFLSGTSYSLGMAATLRWIFKNPEDRQRWGQQLLSLSPDELAEGLPRSMDVRLRYESFLKETRDINLENLGDMGSKDCSSDLLGPCLDAFRLFRNTTIPSYESLVQELAENSDLILPQAFLTDPEIVSYGEIEPALAGIRLEPDAAELEEWNKLRSRFVNLYARVSKLLQRADWMQAPQEDVRSNLHALLQDISSQAAPCYRPILDFNLCGQQAGRLEQNFQDLKTRLQKVLYP